jgi:alkaline phosphatase
MLDFDRAVGVALEFAAKDGETLVIVTSDHETGGMTINGGSFEEHSVTAKYTSTKHTAVMIPTFAYGPGAEAFIGIYDNTDLFVKMMTLFGY